MQKPSYLLQQFLPFIKYCTVGVLGTGIHLVVVILLVEFAGLHPVYANFFGFLTAVSNNFLLNKSWTFRDRSRNYRKLWIKFFLVSCIGLLITLGLTWIFVEELKIHYIVSMLLTSLIVLTWNFFANKYWTFNAAKQKIIVPAVFPFDYSIVIPAYNEESRIVKTLQIIDEYLRNMNIKAEIIVVSDGSTDDTVHIVRKLREKIPNLILVANKKNFGKGFAVKTGIEVSRGEFILFTDADNSTPIEELEMLIKRARGNEIVIGSRWLKDSRVKRRQSRLRIFIGRFGNLLIRFFLIDGIADTQCGFKLFHHEAAKQIFSRQKVNGFGFDIEALVIAKSLNYRISEVPVSWINSDESRFRPVRDAVRTFLDLIYIKLNLWSGRYF